MRKSPKKAVPLTLRLYVAGHGPNSLLAIENLNAVCSERFKSGHKLEIVDMLAEPGRALADQIVVTPTLLKLLPLPERRVVGSLSDREELVRALGPG